MRWFNDIVEKQVKKNLDEYILKFENLKNEVIKFRHDLQSLQLEEEILERTQNHLKIILDRTEGDIISFRETLVSSDKRNFIRMDENSLLLRQEIETSVSNLIQIFNKRLDALGDKRGMVTDLLKKIAKLEGDLEDKNAVS